MAPLAPRPYTAVQLRAASPVGRVMRYHLTTGARGVTIEYRFLASDAAQATIRTTETPDGGAAGPPVDGTASWEALAGHADSPAAATVIRAAEITVPAGTFACKEYAVTSVSAGVTSLMTLDFADAMPGPPVRMVVTTNGAVASTLELQSYAGLGQ